jgi:hypothetical protein
VPRLKGIGFALYADTLVRFALRSPSGKTLIPGETPENAEYRVLAVDQGRSWILAVGNPEAGEWTVTTEAARLTGPTRYYFDVRADDPVVEETHVEVFSRDGDPRTVNSVPPGEPVYVRVFVATGELAVPGVRWNVVATSYDGPPIPIAVEDDGHHADGAAGDGVFVGAFVAAEEPLHWINVNATTPQGTRYTEESRVEVMERGDLLIADTIEVSPDPRGGIPVTLTVTVENKGTLDFKNVNLDLFLALGETKWEEKGARQTFDIRAGESRRVSTSWIPSPRQEYLVRLTIEPFLEPFTSDLANNTRKTIVRVR